MGGNMEELSFEAFSERIRQKLEDIHGERDLHAFELPDVLGDPEYIKFLTIEYNFTDRVN